MEANTDNQNVQTYITIDTLLNHLAYYRATYGDLPILVSTDSADKDFLRPLASIFTIDLVDTKTNDKQPAVVLSNYIIEGKE